MGIIVPLACLYFDPALFQGGLVPLSPGHVAFCYALIGTSMAAFSFRLAFRRGGAFFAGAIAAGGVFAGLLGLILLPITALFVIGMPSISLAGLLMLCLGTLSATPLFASYVYFRLARDAWRQDEPFARLRVRSFAVLGFLAVFAIAVLAQRGVHAEFDRIADAAIEGRTIGSVELTVVRLLAWGNEPDYILERYATEADQEKQKRLAGAYELLTRQDIDARIRQLDD